MSHLLSILALTAVLKFSKPKFPKRSTQPARWLILGVLVLLFCGVFVLFVDRDEPQSIPPQPLEEPGIDEEPGVTEVELADALDSLPPTEIASTDGSWQTYTEADGLPHHEISAIAIDGAGRVWVSSVKGLSKFDDQTWTTYTPDPVAGEVIYNLVIDAAGHIWCASSGGLYEFDGQAWTVHLRPGQVLDNWVQVIAIDQEGRIWAGFGGHGAGGVGVFDGEQWTTYTPADGLAGTWIQAIAVDPAGHVWVGYGSQGNGVSEFNGETWTTYTTADGLAHNWVNGIAIDWAGRKWFATGAGVSRFSGESWASYTRANGLPADLAHSIAVSPAKQVWAGVFNGQAESVALASGVSVLDDDQWTLYNESVGLAGNGVSGIAFDAAGQVWLATSGGVSRFRLDSK